MNKITQVMHFRLALIKYAEKHGVAKAAIKYKTNRQYIYQWKQRYNDNIISYITVSQDSFICIKSFAEKTGVTFQQITAEEIEAYIDTKDHKDKAGSYGIQGPFSLHIPAICGDYNNVVGFPLARIYKELKALCAF